MLDIKLIREQTDLVKNLLARRGVKSSAVDAVLAADEHWRNLTTEEGALSAQQKTLGKEERASATELKKRRTSLQKELTSVAEERRRLLIALPNIPFEDAPVGDDEKGNIVMRTVGKPPVIAKPEDYFSIAERLDLIDTKRAGKVSGTRFGYLKNEAVLLEFALIRLAFAELMKEGFTPMLPPVLVKPDTLHAMGKGKFIEDKEMFHIPDDDLYLVGSAEHSIGPYHAGEIFREDELPKRYVGLSSCFRRESGSYGKDTRGMLRVHQFDKVEMVSFCAPEESESEHRFMLSLEERLMEKLELHYRVVELCTGDMTFADRRQFDIETWFPSEGRFRETHSCSNTTDFQARGLNTRYKDRKGSTAFVHMLNGTVFSQRPIYAIIEQCQQKDGSVRIPRVLHDLTGIEEIRR